MRTTAINIDTEHGTGEVWWDDESDPSNPGWVLRYHLEPEGSDEALGRRHLDEILEPERQIATCRSGEVAVAATDTLPTAHVGSTGAAGVWLDDDADDLLAVAGYRRVSDWSDDDGIATCQVVSVGAALREALRFLARHEVGAGRRLTSQPAAEVAGLKDGASWRASPWRPDPDDHHDARTPWWWETTVLRAMAARPGKGARTDLREGQ